MSDEIVKPTALEADAIIEPLKPMKLADAVQMLRDQREHIGEPMPEQRKPELMCSAEALSIMRGEGLATRDGKLTDRETWNHRQLEVWVRLMRTGAIYWQ